jgi:hypothetical protein
MEIATSGLRKVLLALMLASGSWAQAAQDAVVAVDGSMVYKSADFDAAVIGYLPRGKQVKVSSKPFGAFHRVGLKQGMVGYISDADLLSMDGRPMSDVNQGKLQQKLTKGGKEIKVKRDRSTKLRPVAVATAVGPMFGLVQYRELINRRDYSDQIGFFGLKYTTRASFIDGSFGMEIDALYFSGAPNYYKAVSSVAPGGFIALFDLILTYSLFDFSRHKGAFTVGAGPFVGYSEIRTELNGQKFKQNRTEIGAVINGTLNYRVMAPLILKGEVRYYIEKSAYMGYHAGVLYAFN